MQNKSTTARKGRFSRFLANRAKDSFKFIRNNQGSLICQNLDTGAVKVTFRSPHTGRTAFAYGATFRLAYRNLQRNFNLKYSA